MRNPNPTMHRSNVSAPYSSQLCILFQKGKCNYGENCHYAHSISDLRNPGFETVAAERHRNEDNQRNGEYKSRPCYWSFSGRHCPYGERCRFLHKYDHMDIWNESLQKKSFAISVANVGKDKNGSEQYRVLTTDDDRMRLISYKTRLCANWESFGRSSHGVKCTYAHGETELGSHKKEPQVKGKELVYLAELASNKKEPQVKGYCFTKWDVEKIGRIYGVIG